MEPDFAGFTTAMEDKRSKFGSEVPFFFLDAEWPDVPVDEEGAPLDPSVPPLKSTESMVQAKAEVTNRPVAGGARGLQPPSDEEAVGRIERNTLVLIVSEEDFEEKNLADAIEVEVFDRRYVIRDAVPDQMGPGDTQRRLIFVEKK